MIYEKHIYPVVTELSLFFLLSQNKLRVPRVMLPFLASSNMTCLPYFSIPFNTKVCRKRVMSAFWELTSLMIRDQNAAELKDKIDS